MKTIVVFHPSCELYGADRILVNALQSFPKNKLKIVYLLKDGPLIEYIEQNVKNVLIVIQPKMPIFYQALFSIKGVFKCLTSYWSFEKWFRNEHQKHQFDLAYVNTLSCFFLLRTLKKLKVRSFVHVHEIIERPKLAAWTMANFVNKYSDYIVCVSKATENSLARIVPGISSKSYCIHNGIPSILADEKEVHGRLTFYLFGRITPKKGQWYLIEALSQIPRVTLEKSKFVIVGGTPLGKEHLLESLAEKIKEAGLESVVSMKGFCNDIRTEMNKADVCIVPSLMNGSFPIAVLEAMSAEKPVIVTKNSGAAEMITDGSNGFLIPPNDSNQFAQVLIEMIESKSRVKEMGMKAKEVFENKFTLERFQSNWRAIHRQNRRVNYRITDPK